MQKKEKRQKYNNKKVEVEGILFDSKDEALYYEYLLDLFDNGNLIKSITVHPKYELIPKFTDCYGVKHRATTYTLDFLIEYNDGDKQLVDVKGFGTQQGDLRRKLFMWKFPELELRWISRSLKYGDKNGWADYDELKKIRRINKKEKRT